MKVLVLENFNVYDAADQKVEHRKGMVLQDVPEEVGNSWIAKALVEEVDLPSKPAAEDPLQ